MSENTKSITKLGVKWLPAALGAYILGRALAVFIVPGFQETVLSSDTQFGNLFGLKFMYIMGTFGLPLVLAALVSEVSDGRLNRNLFRFILIAHMLAAILAGVVSILGNIGSHPCSISEGGPENTCNTLIISMDIFVRGMTVTIGVPVVTAIAILWEKKNWKLFRAAS